MDQKAIDFLNAYDLLVSELKATELAVKKLEDDMSNLLKDFPDVEEAAKRLRAIQEKEKEDAEIAILLNDIDSGSSVIDDKIAKSRRLEELRRAKKISDGQFKNALVKIRKKGVQSKPNKV